ncbi:serine-rich adhesin for platelets isoform X2 [Drosophila guanche]|uniref:serine-rich adhesin for platelets isoform X2 n=1 Tax=Drosophila guanche TaxID=7266 RepID=UPI0014723A8C|nr:serine-rich adhesin for platelets isoform X2 [Drosophila guanche]
MAPKMPPFSQLDKMATRTSSWVCRLLLVSLCIGAAAARDIPSSSIRANSLTENVDVAFYCPGEGLFADDYDCRIYYRCEQRSEQYIRPYMLACKENTVFSRTLRMCLPPSMAGRDECVDQMNEIDGSMGGLGDGSDGYDGLVTDGQHDDHNALLNAAVTPAANELRTYATANQLPTNYGLTGLNGVSVISFSSSSSSSLRAALSGEEGADEVVCRDDGFMSDPSDCTVFYRCISNGRGYNKIGFRCSDGTAWDESLQSCNHMFDVRANGGCRNQAQTEPQNDGYYAGQTSTQSSQSSSHQNSTSSSTQQSSSSTSSSSSSSSQNSSTSSSSTSSNQESSTSSSNQQSSNQSSGNNQSNESSSNNQNQSSGGSQTSQSSGNNSNESSNNTQSSGSNQSSNNNQSSGSQSSNNNQSSGSQSSSNNQSSGSNQGSSSGSNSTSNKPETTECENEMTYIPDKKDCAKFYRCRLDVDNKLEQVPFTCGPGTVWNQKDKVCDLPTEDQKKECNIQSGSSSGQQSSGSNQGSSSSGNQSAANSSSSSNSNSSNNNQSGSSQESTTTSGSSQQSSSNQGSSSNQSGNQGSSGNQESSTSSTSNNQQSSTSSSNQGSSSSNQGSSSSSNQSSSSSTESSTQGSSSNQSSSESSSSNQGASSSNQGNSSTTTQKPFKPAEKCESEETFLADKENCAKFYRCVDNGKGGFTMVSFTCPPNTLWDPEANSCNHPDQIQSQPLKCKKVTSSSSSSNSTSSSSSSTTGGGSSSNQGSSSNTGSSSNQGSSSNSGSSSNQGSSSNSGSSSNQGSSSNTGSSSNQGSSSNSGSTSNQGSSSTSSSTSNNNNTQGSSSSSSSSSGSSSSATTSPTPANPSEPCKQNGQFIGDKTNCAKFYRCVDNDRGGFTMIPFTCGPGTVWDADIQSCNHAWAVKGCGGAATSSSTHKPGTGPITSSTSTARPSTPRPTSSQTGTTSRPTTSRPTTSRPTTSRPTSQPSSSSSTARPTPTSSPNTDGQCRAEGFMADPNNCSKFYRCVSNGKGGFTQIPFQCGAGTVWDQDLQTCNHNFNNCNTSTATEVQEKPPCETTTNNGTTTVTSTPSTTTMSTTTPSTTITTTALPTTTEQTTTSMSPPSTTTEVPSTTMTSTTGSGSTGSTENSEPVTTTMTPSTTTMKPLPAGTECEGEGYMADPEDCRKYYRCISAGNSYRRYNFTCPKGTGWNEDVQTCDYMENIPRCANLPSTTTEPPTTTTTIYTSTTQSETESTVTESAKEPETTPTKPEGPTTTQEPTTKPTPETTTATDKPTSKPTPEPETSTVTDKPTSKPTPEPETTTIIAEKPTTKPTPEPETTTMGAEKPTTKPTPEPSTETTNVPTTTTSPGYTPTTSPSIDTTTMTQETTTTDNPASTTNMPEPAPNYNCTAEGFFADPEDCSHYYRCVDGSKNGNYQVYSFKCPKGTVWDTSAETCNYADQVSGNCSSSTTGSPTTTGRPTETTENPGETTETSTARPTEPTTQTPRPETTTSSTPVDTTTTDAPIDTTTTSSAPPTSSNGTEPCPSTGPGQDVYVCPTGFRRHPQNCGMFYQCSENADSNDLNIVVFQCPNGTVYQDKSCSCGKPEAGDTCSKGQKRTHPNLFEDQTRRQNMVQISSTSPLCPDVGHFALNEDECSQLFVKCGYSEQTGRIEGQIYRCPQGFAYWNVSRRCEPARKLMNCTPTTYNVAGNVPLEWLNIGNRRRSLRI